MILLDASVAIAWLLDESRPDWVDRVFTDARSGATQVAVPSLFWLEVGNVLTHAGGLTDDQALDGMLRLDAMGMETIDPDRPLRLQALILARETRLTMYDATYLALAISSGARLATLDEELGTAAASRGLALHDRHGIRELPTAYGHDPDATSVAAIGEALARLRLQPS